MTDILTVQNQLQRLLAATARAWAFVGTAPPAQWPPLSDEYRAALTAMEATLVTLCANQRQGFDNP